MHYIWPWLWNKKITSLDVTKFAGQTLTRSIIKAYVKEKLNADGDQVKQNALVEFIFQMQFLTGTTETCLYDLFECGLFPYFPVLDKLKTLNKQVSFVFGDKDWVDSTGAEVLITHLTRGLYSAESLCNLHIINGAEHQIQNERPQQLA